MKHLGGQDQRYRHDKDLETLTVTLPNGDKITMWSYAIDVRASDDPVKLPERGFNEKDDHIVFPYTDKEATELHAVELVCGCMLSFIRCPFKSNCHKSHTSLMPRTFDAHLLRFDSVSDWFHRAWILFVRGCSQGFDNITSSKQVWASLSPQIDSNFGFGVYSARKAPHQWRSKKEIFINNFFPSRKDWEQRKHLDFTEWPSLEALKFNKPELTDRQLDELLNTPFGLAVLKKWEPTRKCDFCIPIVCDYHSAQD